MVIDRKIFGGWNQTWDHVNYSEEGDRFFLTDTSDSEFVLPEEYFCDTRHGTDMVNQKEEGMSMRVTVKH